MDEYSEPICHAKLNKKQNFGDEVPKNETEISTTIKVLSKEQNLEVHHAVYVLKIYEGKEHFWKKVKGEKTGDFFYYNCLTKEYQLEQPVGYVDVMEEPVWNKTKENIFKEDDDLIFDDKNYEKLVKRIMILVGMDDNGKIKLEELENIPGVQDILQKYFEQLNVDYLTKRDICDLFPTKKELSKIFSELENSFLHEKRDPFLFGMKVRSANTSTDECAREIRRILNDLRLKVELTNKDNFTVCLESRSEEGIIYLGSGVIIEKHSQYAILTAGHCVANTESGNVDKNDCIRIFIPTIPTYNTDTNIYARFKRIDPRFNTIIVDSTDFYVYPWYVDDGHTGSGTDIGMIKLPGDKLKTFDFSSIPCANIFTYVRCQNGHILKSIGTDHSNGWRCDGYEIHGRCLKECTGFNQTNGWKRFRCDICNFDLCEECILQNSTDKYSDLEIRGFPGEFEKSYVLYSSRKIYNKEQEEEINLFDSKRIKEGNHLIIKYTHQTSAGQSGGPLLLHLENENPLLLGIHVSGHKEVATATGFSPNIINWINFIYSFDDEMNPIDAEKSCIFNNEDLFQGRCW